MVVKEFLFGNIQIEFKSQGLLYKVLCMELGTPHKTQSYLHYQTKIIIWEWGRERERERRKGLVKSRIQTCVAYFSSTLCCSLYLCLSFFCSLYVFVVCVFALFFCICLFFFSLPSSLFFLDNGRLAFLWLLIFLFSILSYR